MQAAICTDYVDPSLSEYPRRNAIFIDLHGVIVREAHYAHRPDQLEFIPGALEALVRLSKLDADIIIVTNQGGVAIGDIVRHHEQHGVPDWTPPGIRNALEEQYAHVHDYDLKAMQTFNERVIQAVKDAGGRIDAVLCAIDLEAIYREGMTADVEARYGEAGINLTPTGEQGTNYVSQALKPSRAMYDIAQDQFGPWEGERVMIGDKSSDIRFGQTFDATTIRITDRSGPGGYETGPVSAANADHDVADLAAASNVIEAMLTPQATRELSALTGLQQESSSAQLA